MNHKLIHGDIVMETLPVDGGTAILVNSGQKTFYLAFRQKGVTCKFLTVPPKPPVKELLAAGRWEVFVFETALNEEEQRRLVNMEFDDVITRFPLLGYETAAI